jgi:hypothetical protein
MNRWMAALACAGIALGLSLTATSEAKAQNQSASKGEWVSLFDGKTLSGWEMIELGNRKGASKWEVKDGAIVGTGQASMLFSPKGHYQNFRFRAEIKINDRGNSGMYIHVPAKKGTFTDGYEIQINSTHSDPIKTGSVYTMVHVYKQLAKPDTWFVQEVESVTKNYRGKVLPHLKIWVDGELLYEYIDHSNAFPGPGYFAFQQHDPGSVVQIRKVEVMELPASK